MTWTAFAILAMFLTSSALSSLSSLTQVDCENAGSSFLFAAILGPNNRQGQVIQNGPQKTHLTQNVSTYFYAGETEVFGQPQLSCWFPSKNVKPETLNFAIWSLSFFLQQEKILFAARKNDQVIFSVNFWSCIEDKLLISVWNETTLVVKSSIGTFSVLLPF